MSFATAAVNALRDAKGWALEAYHDFVVSKFAPNSLQVNQMGFGLGLAGEAGEVADLIKKQHLHHRPVDAEFRDKLKKELGDTIWYWFALCQVYEFDPADVIATNVEKLEERANDAAYAAKNPNVPTNTRTVEDHPRGSKAQRRRTSHYFEKSSTGPNCDRCTLPESLHERIETPGGTELTGTTPDMSGHEF